MLKFRNNIQVFGNYAFFAGLLITAASLPLSVYVLSISQFVIAGAWLLQADLKDRCRSALRQPYVWLTWSIYFMALIGLWNTENYTDAFKMLRIYLPLLFFPLFITGNRSLTVRQYRTVPAVFIASVFVSTAISFAIYLHWYNIPYRDIRDISIFISHIRLSLMICLAIVFCIYRLMQSAGIVKVFLSLLILWFIYFLVLLESATGITILFILSIFFGIRYSLSGSRWLRLLSMTSSAVILIIVFVVLKMLFIDSIQPVVVNKNSLPQFTANGHAYTHKPECQEMQNGHPVWLFVCETELDSVLKARTGHTTFDTDQNGNMIMMTLIRYLASRNLTKDAAGISSLSDDELKAVLNAVPDVRDFKKVPGKRLRNLSWEFRDYWYGGDPTGHSMTMRFEFWKAGWFIVQHNWLTGIGTGDIEREYKTAYESIHTRLANEWRFTSHNQFLLMLILFGAGGLIVFLVALLLPFIESIRVNNQLYMAFFLIAFVSMLSEDTLETAPGVCFYAFFSSFLLMAPRFNAAQFSLR